MNTKPSIFAKSIANLYHQNDAIAHNLAYIQKELPTLFLPNDLRNEISTLCREFESVVYDVRAEIRNLEDKLGLYPGEEPFDSHINPDPRATMSLIEKWIASEVQALDTLVRKLWTLTAQDEQRYSLVNSLVTEAAANILQAQAGMRAELKSISAEWDKRR